MWIRQGLRRAMLAVGCGDRRDDRLGSGSHAPPGVTHQDLRVCAGDRGMVGDRFG
jgi:hypothetical protein